MHYQIMAPLGFTIKLNINHTNLLENIFAPAPPFAKTRMPTVNQTCLSSENT